MTDPLLRRFWFETKKGHGVGVTAYSIDDANALIQQDSQLSEVEIISIVEGVDIRTLDEGHVIPNIGPVNLRGVWFPNLFR